VQEYICNIRLRQSFEFAVLYNSAVFIGTPFRKRGKQLLKLLEWNGRKKKKKL